MSPATRLVDLEHLLLLEQISNIRQTLPSMLQDKALQQVAHRNCQELGKMLPLVLCLAGPKEQYWIELFKFMDRAMPADTADCCLEQLTEDAFTALTYAEQVRLHLPGHDESSGIVTV